MPKAELHMHLEGSIEPEMLLELAARNGMRLRWDTADALRAAYQFSNLQSFLDLYYEGCRVLVREQDFYDITRAYLRRAHADAVVHAEVFIAPQGSAERGVPVAAVMDGVLAAMREPRANMASARDCWSSRSGTAARPRRCNCSTR